MSSLRGSMITNLKDILFTGRHSDDLNDFMAEIRQIDTYTNPMDATLWDIALPVIKGNIKTLLQHREFKELVFEMEDLTVTLLSMLAPSDSGTSATASKTIGNAQAATNGHNPQAQSFIHYGPGRTTD